MQITAPIMNADPRASSISAPEWALWFLLFALAYAQAPLYTSNQNQYFLHGLAAAGYGELSADWLAGTLDPTPLFSALVWLTQGTVGSWFFYVEYGALMGVYLLALCSIARSVARTFDQKFHPRLFLVVITVIHSQAFRYLLARIPGEHWEYLLEAGVAGQRLLGPVFQPSSFGVFLVASLALFLLRRPLAAVGAAALAASFHPTYLLAAACLTAGYLAALYSKVTLWQRPLAVGGAALALVSPVTIYAWRVFGPSGPGTWKRAAEILIEFRIPHHAIPAQWFDLTVALKLLLIAICLLLIRRYRELAFPLMTLATTGLTLSILQMMSGSLRLALLMPWRLSVALVPIATALILSQSLLLVSEPPAWHRPAALLVSGMAALAGLAAFFVLLNRQATAPHQPLIEVVAEQLRPGQSYLIPPKLQEFRIGTGAPAFVDFKSIPYQDRDVLDWYERVRLSQFFYRDDPSFIDCALLDSILEHEPISHVVLEAEQFGLDCPSLVVQYQDEHYALYELTR